MRSLKKLAAVLFSLCLCLLMTAPVDAHDPMVPIGDLTRLEGVRSNQLVGYGLVTGLEGSGDSSRSQAMIQSISNMLSTFGVDIEPGDVWVRNVAAVMVTAELPSFARQGDQIDVSVSSLGDARSLEGGMLLLTPLQAPNREVYAVAQGPVSIGGFNVRGMGAEVTRNHPTSGRIPEGAIVEQEIDVDFSQHQELTFILNQPRFETAGNVASKINENFEMQVASATDASRVKVDVPEEFENRVVDFISQVKQIQVPSTIAARVVVNERTGTVVMGHNVRISTVAVAHGNLTVIIEPREVIIDPEDDGDQVVIREVDVDIEEEDSSLALVGGATISDLVQALNAVGTTPRDLVAILQAIKAQGALHAQLEIM